MVLLQSHFDVIFKIKLGLGVISLGLKVHDKVVLDGKDGVDGKMWVVAGVNLIDDSGVVGVCDHKVNMCRTHGRAVHDIQQNTGGTVGGQRIWRGVVAVPVELSVGIRHELSAEVVLGLLGVLEVVFAVGGGLPDVEHGALDGLACFHVRDDSVHVGDFAIGVGVLDDAVAEFAEGSVGRPEGAENDIGGGGEALFGDDFVCNFVDQSVIVSYALFLLC